MKIRILNSSDKKEIGKIISRKKPGNVEQQVKEIISKVKNEGDYALKYYAKRFDNLELKNLEVSPREIKDAYSNIGKKQIMAIKSAAKNIRKFAKFQLPKAGSLIISGGIECGFIISPIERIGCYIPGGKYPLPSTIMMTVLPAKVAGVKEVVLVTPKPEPGILVAADICGVNKIYNVGGAQAIAALAYGTKSIQKVDKIVGPGNIFVTEAKKQVFGDVGIDMLAGPSEILIISENGDARFIASDMLAQAEHDEMACGVLITTSKKLAFDVCDELKKQSEKLKTKEVIEKSFNKYSCIILAKDLNEAIEISNMFAPEHLEIDSKYVLKKITNAGSIFIGKYSCEAAGDYCSGTNHVLPTSGNARFRGGLSVFDFIKMQTYQKLTKEGLKELKDTISTLAEMENLPAHKNSVIKRFEGDEK